MKKLVFILILLIMLLFEYKSLAAEINYSPAIDKTRDALYVQIGAKDFFEQAGNKLKDKADAIGMKWPLVIALTGYQVYKNKQIETKEFKNPIQEETKHKVTVSPNTITLLSKWSF